MIIMEGVNRNTEFAFKISLKNFVIKTTSLVICQKPRIWKKYCNNSHNKVDIWTNIFCN